MEVRENKAVKADGTRWVPHLQRALNILLSKNFQVVVLHFNIPHKSGMPVRRCKEGLWISKKPTSYKFVAVMHLLLDIVGALSKVSLSFQEDGITISRVQDKLTTLSATLESFKTRPGQHLNYFLTEVGDANTVKGIEFERDPADRQAISAIQASVVHEIHPREVWRDDNRSSFVSSSCSDKPPKLASCRQASAALTWRNWNSDTTWSFSGTSCAPQL